MKTIEVTFKNRPDGDGTLTPFIKVAGCLVARNGSPTADRPEILIHLPKTFTESVDGAWVEYDGHDYHVVGEMPVNMDPNTPTNWNRYVVAERPTKAL